MRRTGDEEPYCAEGYWSDVADLDHDMHETNARNGMWEYLTECLLVWMGRGVSGFRYVCVQCLHVQCLGAVLDHSTSVLLRCSAHIHHNRTLCFLSPTSFQMSVHQSLTRYTNQPTESTLV